MVLSYRQIDYWLASRIFFIACARVDQSDHRYVLELSWVVCKYWSTSHEIFGHFIHILDAKMKKYHIQFKTCIYPKQFGSKYRSVSGSSHYDRSNHWTNYSCFVYWNQSQAIVKIYYTFNSNSFKYISQTITAKLLHISACMVCIHRETHLKSMILLMRLHGSTSM